MQEASIAFMAGTMASQWRGSLACHLQTVTLRWPMRNLQHETSQLVVQCANKWGLAFPPAPEATPALLTQVGFLPSCSFASSLGCIVSGFRCTC